MNCDVLVMGAGIAGSVVAKRLSGLGARVVLIGRPSGGGFEGVSERSVRLLNEEGAQLDGRAAERSGAWGGRRVEGREWLVEREELASSLRRTASAAGAEVREGLIRSFERRERLWLVESDRGLISAPWLVDARGRRGPALCGPRLLAVTFAGRIRREARPVTRIEPFSSGWCWWMRRDDVLFVQVTRRPRGAPPQAWLSDAARELPQLRVALESAEGISRVSARPAHARCAPECANGSLWRAGDAAWAPDPLSGQGIFEALRGAQLVATALGSVMNDGEPEIAKRFVADRHAHAFQRGVAIATDFYRENAERGPFWRDVCAEYAGIAGATPKVSPRIESKPVLLHGRIVLRDVLVTEDYPRGVWQVGGVPIVPLLAAMQSCPDTLRDEPSRNQRSAALELARRWLQQQVGPRIVARPASHEELIRADS